jgi:hypothetical protein
VFDRRTPSRSRHSPWRRWALALGSLAVALSFGSALAGCGGSSSETPPPLEPLPANVHYDRSATTLPGEMGTPTHPQPKASATPAPAPTPFHPSGPSPKY